MLSRLFKVEEIVIELHAIQVSCQGLTRGRGVLTRSAAFLSLFPKDSFAADYGNGRCFRKAVQARRGRAL